MKDLKQIIDSCCRSLKVVSTSILLGGALLMPNEARTEEYIPFTLTKKENSSENKGNRPIWFSFGFEPIKFAGDAHSRIHFNNVPEYVRTVPTHPDDPYLSLEPLKNRQTDIKISSEIFDFLTIKCWLLDTVGVGISLRANSPVSVDGSLDATGHEERGDRYDYAQHYDHGWLPAYTMYQIFTENEPASYFRYFIEAKTPKIKINIRDPEIKSIGFGLFGGYEPNNGKIRMHAVKGWERRNRWQFKEKYDLGVIEFDRVYGGIEIGIIGDDNENSGFRLYYIQDLARKRLTDTGKDFGINVKQFTPIVGGSFHVGF